MSIFSAIQNFFNGSAIGALNNNFTTVEAELTNRLRRDGTAPMSGNLDMNSHRIINHPSSVLDSDLATLGNVKTIAVGISKGPPGSAANTYVDLAAFKASDINRTTAQLANVPGVPDGIFTFQTAGAPYTADDLNIIKADGTSLSVGAWVRQAASGITFLQSGTGAVARTIQDKAREFVSVLDFGADPTGVANSTTAMKAAIASAVSRKVPLQLAGGTFLLDADGEASGGVNFAAGGLRVIGGGATLKYTGTGRGFVANAVGADGTFLEAMEFNGFRVVGGAAITDAFYFRGIVRSMFRNLEARTFTGKAFNIKHGVSNHYDSLKYSALPSDGYFGTHGLYIDNNGAGYYTANCVFTNPVMENFAGVGCYLADATSVLVHGGTFEACTTGLIISNGCNDNLFAKVWMEGNTSADAVISGSGNGFVGPKFLSASSGLNVQIQANGLGTWFTGGGYIRAVSMAAGSTGTSFRQVGVDENLGGTLAFQGTGSYTRSGCTKINGSGVVSGVYPDIVGAVSAIGVSGTWTPSMTAGSGSFSLNSGLTTGTYQQIGNLMFIQGFIYVDTVTSPSGNLSITNLPVAVLNRTAGSIYAVNLASSATSQIEIRGGPNTTSLEVFKLVAGVATGMAGDVKADSNFTFSMTYLVS